MRRWLVLALFSTGCISASCDPNDVWNPCPGHASPSWFVASSCDCPLTTQVLSGAADGEPCAPAGTDCFAGAVGPACVCADDGRWSCDAVTRPFDLSAPAPADLTPPVDDALRDD